MSCTSSPGAPTRRRSRGQSLVEFALIAPFVLLLLVGGSDLARAYFVGVQVADGARQAALYAAENPQAYSSSYASLLESVATHNTGSNGSGLAGTVLDCPASDLSASAPSPTADTASGFDDQKITVTCTLPLFTPLLPSPVTIRASAVGLVAEGVLAVETTSLPDGVVGSAYSDPLEAYGGAPPYSWSVVGGQLPPGLTLGTDGVLAGSPTAAGLFSFTVLVSDSSTPVAQTAEATVSMTVREPLSIQTTTLSGGTVGTAYSQSIVVSGGAAPYTWAVTAGTLPPGLSLDSSTGAISGKPTTAGSSSFTITVTDSTVPNPQTATQSYTITISS